MVVSILDKLASDKERFNNGHVKIYRKKGSLEGIVQGSDNLINLVLDETVEYLRGMFSRNLFSDVDDPLLITNKTRTLGLVVCRGTLIVSVCPADTMESIDNPFVQLTE